MRTARATAPPVGTGSIPKSSPLGRGGAIVVCARRLVKGGYPGLPASGGAQAVTVGSGIGLPVGPRAAGGVEPDGGGSSGLGRDQIDARAGGSQLIVAPGEVATAEIVRRREVHAGKAGFSSEPADLVEREEAEPRVTPRRSTP
jgi:hypothetical protein